MGKTQREAIVGREAIVIQKEAVAVQDSATLAVEAITKRIREGWTFRSALLTFERAGVAEPLPEKRKVRR